MCPSVLHVRCALTLQIHIRCVQPFCVLCTPLYLTSVLLYNGVAGVSHLSKRLTAWLAARTYLAAPCPEVLCACRWQQAALPVVRECRKKECRELKEAPEGFHFCSCLDLVAVMYPMPASNARTRCRCVLMAWRRRRCAKMGDDKGQEQQGQMVRCSSPHLNPAHSF